MKFHVFMVKNADGTEKEAQIGIPETLEELVQLIGPERPYRLAVDEYVRKAKKRAKSNRSVRLHLKMNELTVDQVKTLRKIGLLK